MSFHENYFISYPDIRHPLSAESLDLKLKYITLIEYYRQQVCPTNRSVQNRFERFKRDFLSESGYSNPDMDSSIKAIMKTRFTSFRFFSYRYVFLFDCLYILSVDGFDHVQKIGNLMKGSVNKRYHKKIDYILEKILSDPSALSSIQMITPEMIQSLMDAQEFLATKEKSVVFTATMSAGKSTLINAIIGRPLAKTKKAACTAAITEFCSCPVSHPRCNVFLGDKEERDLMPLEVRSTAYNGAKPLTVTSFFNARVNKHKLRVIDTPGVNSSQNPIHKEITRNELQSRHHDLIVYVIPVENYGGEDDFIHLQFIKNNAQFGKIIFVVNMMDSCDFEDDSVDEILMDIRSHLETIGYLEPIICPLSAKAGLLFKRALSNSELTQSERKDLNAFCLKFADPDYDMGRFGKLRGEDVFCEEWHPSEGLHRDHILQLYYRTGLPQFESAILDAIEEE